MKVSLSVRSLYQEIRKSYERLKSLVDTRLQSIKHSRWHYESRIKELESYALKLETGREQNPTSPEDMLGCTLVVENHSRISSAVQMLEGQFTISSRRPEKPEHTQLQPSQFSFDDLRLYVKWKDDESQPPTGLTQCIFEIQIKTFLQHAWGIATHDLVYKPDTPNWGTSRVAYQVKAMLENAELSISTAKSLTTSTMLSRSDKATLSLIEVISDLESRWTEEGTLPKSIQRLAENILHLVRYLDIRLPELWAIVDKATESGRGARMLDLSPYGAILDALITERGSSLFDALEKGNARIFVPGEIELPTLKSQIRNRIITPTRILSTG